MAGFKTSELPGTRAELRYCRMSATKARAVLSLIRGREVAEARELLRLSPRGAARVVAKVLASAVANAEHNDQLDPEQLYVASCYADEANTLKRWRPRARGRVTRIRKRSCHITVIVSRLPEERARRGGPGREAAQRARRVAAARRSEQLLARRADTAGEEVSVAAVQPDREQGPEVEEGVDLREGPDVEQRADLGQQPHVGEEPGLGAGEPAHGAGESEE